MIKKLIIAGLVILALKNSSLCFSNQRAIEEGLGWLSAIQEEDGKWKGSITTDFHTTAEVIDTIYYLETTNPKAILWVLGQEVEITDYLARKIAVLATLRSDTSNLVATLTSYQNDDGGWGGYKDFSSSILDTALSLQALKSHFTNKAIIQRALGYLLSHQNLDGGWGFGEEGNVYLTSIVLLTLNQYRSQYYLEEAIKKAKDWLLTQTGESLWEKALVYSSLLKPYDTLDYIMTNQLDNGSWEDDPYTTALCLKALANSRANLTLSNIVLNPSFPYQGDEVNISSFVYNTGCIPATNVSLSFYIGESLLKKEIIPKIEGKDKLLLQATFSTALSLGSETITLVVDEENAIPELNEGDNVSSSTITILPTQTDLVPLSILFTPPYPTEGERATITAYIANYGNTDVRNVEVAFYDAKGTESKELGIIMIEKILGGDVIPTQIEWDTSFEFETHTIYAVVDPSNLIPETNKTNNIGSSSIFITPKIDLPDLAPLRISFSNNWPFLGEKITITTSVINKGLLKANDIQFIIYDGDPNRGGIPINYGTITLLKPNQEENIQLDWIATKEGEHKIYVVIDPNNLIPEINELNNEGYIQINVGFLSDLSIEPKDITFSHTDITLGGKVIIKAVIHNIGSATSPPVLVDIYDGETLIEKEQTKYIPPNGSLTLYFKWYPSIGSHSISVHIDSENLLLELNEENNKVLKEVEIGVPESKIILYKIKDDQRIEDYTYSAYENMEIKIIHSWQGVYLKTEIIGQEKRILLLYPKENVYKWNTYNYPPGNYKIRVAIIDEKGVLLEEKERLFIIEPFGGIAETILQIVPTYSYVKKEETIEITGALINASNIPISLSIEYLLFSPKNELVYSHHIENITLLPEDICKAIKDNFTYTFDESGEYPLKMNIYSFKDLLRSKSFVLAVLPNVRIETKKEVSPTHLYPNEKGKVKIIIELKGIKDE